MDARDEAERLRPYRRVRDEIKTLVDTLPEGLSGGDQAERSERTPKEDDV